MPLAPGKRILGAALIVTVLVAAGLLLRYHASLVEILLGVQHAVTGWVAAYPVPGAALYVIATALGKVTPFPGGIALMLVGGYLFGPLLGGVLAALGAALSAGLVAIVGRRLVFEAIMRRWGTRLARLEDAVVRDGFNYVLAVRLLPVMPAWLANLLPVAFPIPIRHVLLATFIGLLPISLILATLGSRLASLSAAEAVSPAILLDPAILLPLLGLSGLAVAPALVRQIKRRRRR